MAASSTLTFDQDPPRRPILDDVGGASKSNDLEFPPNPAKDPTAEEYNQISKLAVAAGMQIPVAVFDVRFSGGTPSVYSVKSNRSSEILIGDLTVTDDAVGQTTIEWPSDALPAPTHARVDIRGTDPHMASHVITSNSVQVTTHDAGGASDVDFVVSVY